MTVEFQPQRAAYEAAVASGGPRLIQQPDLWSALSEFDQAHDYYMNHNRLYRQVYFLGPLSDVRGRLGTLRALTYGPDSLPSTVALHDSAYSDVVSRPEVIGAIEAGYYAMISVQQGLEGMAAQTDSVLASLGY